MDARTDNAPKPTFLRDYRPPAWLVDAIDLDIALDPDCTRVAAQLKIRINPAAKTREPLRLDGEAQKLVSIALDGKILSPDRYRLEPHSLTLPATPDSFALEIVSEILPAKNTALEGLYLSGPVLTTQCEAEGFRRITYFPDRPDVLAVFTATLTADAARYPHLLSNGNCVARGTLSGGRHWAKWHDPFPKPCYLFALVAGALDRLEDRFVTKSGRAVDLHLYVDPGNAPRGRFALEALKRAMKWDEDTFGLEYDLDVFQIVAVADFNMGAMENKGLNIFNAKYILADPQTATDQDYQGIEAVVAHEYFHNWTGNRITCRDWFQLSLKEGLTVYRDQEFQADMRGRAIKRIADVRTLRAQQFPEDDGSLAHPVRPESYVEINNFYTATVYEKGAEIIRMIETLIGRENFRKGMALYVARHDGTAATVEDFVKAMEDAGGKDLTQFRRWYAQAGTPRLTAKWHHNAKAHTLDLTLRQSTPPTPGQSDKKPLHIPVKVALLGPDGEIAARRDGAGEPARTHVLDFTAAEQTFRFTGVKGAVTPSLLRGFSAPCRLACENESETRRFLMRHDSDSFNRWDAVQGFATATVIALVEGKNAQEQTAALSEALDAALRDEGLDPAFKAALITLPSERDVAQAMERIDVEAIHHARKSVLRGLAHDLAGSLNDLYRALSVNEPYAPTSAQMGRRALRGAALRLIGAAETAQSAALAERHYQGADNMTDAMAALSVLADIDSEARARALASFYARWKDNALVVDKWLSLQAMSALPGTVEAVAALTRHEAFTLRNPNKVRALIGAFANSNPRNFHRADGAGYRLVGDIVQALDALNPQIAARLATAFDSWKRLDASRQALARATLQALAARPDISPNLSEMTQRLLA